MSNGSPGLTFIGSVQYVPAQAIDTETIPTMVRASDIPSKILSKMQEYKDVTIKHILAEQGDEENATYFILEKYPNGNWVRWAFQNNVDLTTLKFVHLPIEHSISCYDCKLRDWVKLEIPDFINTWKKDKEHSFTGDQELWALDMTPPGLAASTERNIRATNNPAYNPKFYLQKKYYEALFSMRVPLAYFVKSNLVRLSNLCKSTDIDDSVAYQMLISEMLLSFEGFDERHEVSLGGIVKFNFESKAILELREHILIQSFGNSSLQNTPITKALALILKSREIKLQIIILLELISINKMDLKLRDFEEKYKNKLKKRARNVAKAGVLSRRRKQKSKPERLNHLDFCEKLDLYVDKLCIIDVLLLTETSDLKSNEAFRGQNKDAIEKLTDYKKNMTSNGKEASSTGFISFVLIPYYKRRVPHAVDFITRKIKGPKLGSSLPAIKRTSSTSTIVKESLSESNTMCLDSHQMRKTSVTQGSDLGSSSPLSGPSPRIQRNSAFTIQPPLLKTRTESHLRDFLELDSNLLKKPSIASRTNSEILLTKLQKRQLSVSDLASEDTNKRNCNHPELSLLRTEKIKVPVLSRSSTHISFQRVGKRQSNLQANIEKVTTDEDCLGIQVEATPHGKRADQSLTHVVKQPAIVESPLKEFETRRSLCEKTTSLSILNSTFETPVKNSEKETATTDLQVPASDQKTQEVPSGIVNSPHFAPTKKVRRRLFGPRD